MVNFDFKLLIENETLAFCESSGTLKMFNVIGAVMRVAKILVPVGLIIVSTASLTKALFEKDNEKISATVRDLFVKAIIALMIFFIPTIIYALFKNVDNKEKTKTVFSQCNLCMKSSDECHLLINKAIKHEEERAQELSLVKRKTIEEYERLALEAAKKAKINEVIIKDNNQNTNSNSNTTFNHITDSENQTQSQKENSNKDLSQEPLIYYEGGVSYGLGCKEFVDSSSYNEDTVNELLSNAKKYLGRSYRSMDCSDFVSATYSDYIPNSTAAGIGQNAENKCVAKNDVKPGDIFLISQYNKSGECTKCSGSTFGNRCNRFQCIMHTGIVVEVKDGKPTKIIHSSGSGVKYDTASKYAYAPGGSNRWYIMFVRPYA